MTPLILTGDLRLQDAVPLMRQLEEAIDADDVSLDASAVTDADAAVVQVLLAARETARLLGRRLLLPRAAAGPLAARFAALALDSDDAPDLLDAAVAA